MNIRVTKDDDVVIDCRTVERIANIGYDVSDCDPIPTDIHLHLSRVDIINQHIHGTHIEWKNRPDGGFMELRD
jgi:hypothetical protein